MTKNQPKAIERKSPLDEMIDKKVQVMAQDGRVFTGILKGVDQTLNLILGECEERIYSLDQALQIEKIGLYVIRGDSVVMIGELDDHIEEA